MIRHAKNQHQIDSSHHIHDFSTGTEHQQKEEQKKRGVYT